MSAEFLLAIETSHRQGEVALGSRAIPNVVSFSPGLVHARELQPRIDEIFQQQSVARSELGLIAVSAGPGSYTGMRIGVSCAKAMGFALGVPTLAISTIEVIARNVTDDGLFAVLLDARRGACYSALFEGVEDDEGRVRIERRGPDTVSTPAELWASLPAGTPLVGEGCATIEGAAEYPRLAEEWDLPHARHLYDVARARWQEIVSGQAAAPPEFEDPHVLAPSYLRLSQAEEGRAQSTG